MTAGFLGNRRLRRLAGTPVKAFLGRWTGWKGDDGSGRSGELSLLDDTVTVVGVLLAMG